MEAVTIIVSLIIIIFGILEIILFFKMWGMCNDVKSITYLLNKIEDEKHKKEKKPESIKDTDSSESMFTAGQLVIDKETQTQFRVTDIVKGEDGSVLIYSGKLDKYFQQDEIDDFKEYWEKHKIN